MRLFVALDITDDVRARIQRFIEGVSGFAPDARWVSPESLHLTLKFIGEKSGAFAEDIQQALSTVKSEPLEITFRGHGFFPGPKHARVFWIGVEAGPQLASVASAVDRALIPVGVAKCLVNQLSIARAALDTAFYCRTDEQEGRFATRLSVPQHFEGQGRRPRLGLRHANTTFSVAAGCLSGYGHVMGSKRSLRRQMEGEPVQKQAHRRNEG